MGIYWRIRSLPEFKALPASEQTDVLMSARFKGCGVAAALALAGGCGLFGLSLASSISIVAATLDTHRLLGRLWFLMLMAATIAALLQLRIWLVRSSLRHRLANLAGRTLPEAACFKCGYDLSGTEGPFCPECGAVIPRTTLPNRSRTLRSDKPEPNEPGA